MERRPGTGRGRNHDEIADVLLAVAPVAGLSQIAAPPAWRSRPDMTSPGLREK
jgi:hypothetical protein